METMSLRVVSGTEARRAPECRVPASRATARADLRIDGWLVQPSLNQLTRNGTSIRLRTQLVDLLLCLASRPGSVFDRDELTQVVWEGRWVADSAFSRCIAELRSALGDDARKPHVIETITKRGYRLIAPVQPVAPHEPAPRPPAGPYAVTADPPARPAEPEPVGELRLLWRRIGRAARFLSWGPPVRAFRS